MMARDGMRVLSGLAEYADTPPELHREVGTALTRADALFVDFQDGRVLTVDDWEAADIRAMLRHDGKAQALDNVLTLPLNQLEWKLTPARGDRGEAAWLNDWLTRPANQGGMSTPFDSIIGQMTSGVAYKRAYFEKVLTVDTDGYFVYDKVAWRPQTTCRLRRDPNTGAFGGFFQEAITRGMQEISGGRDIPIPAMYAYVYFHKANRDPLNGVSDMEIPYWCYKTKQKVMFLFFSFLEGQALPRTIVEAADLGRAMQIADQVSKLRSTGVLPVANTSGANQKIYTLDVSGGTSADHFMQAINYLEHVASVGVLAGFVDLAGIGTGSGRGSMALSQDQSDFFLQSRQAIASEMAESIRNHLLAPLCYWNFGPRSSVPKFEFGPLAEANKTGALTLLQAIIAAPQLSVPDEFVHQLALSVSGVLNLDTDKIDAAFSSAAYKAQREAANAGAPAPVPGLNGLGAVVNGGVRVAQAMQRGTPPDTRQARQLITTGR